jgi:hypothetical protein
VDSDRTFRALELARRLRGVMSALVARRSNAGGSESVDRALSLAGAEPWERRRVAGVIRRIVVDPGPHEARVDVTLADPTATVTVRFGTRRPLPLRLGAELLVDGVVHQDGAGEFLVLPERWVVLEGDR